MKHRCIMTDRKHGRELIGGKGIHPFPTYAQRGRIGQTLYIADIAKLLMDGRAAFLRKREGLFIVVGQSADVVGTDKFGLRGKHHSDFEAHTDLHGILDAETQLQRNLAVCGVDFIAFEAVDIAVGFVVEVAVRVRVEDA